MLKFKEFVMENRITGLGTIAAQGPDVADHIEKYIKSYTLTKSEMKNPESLREPTHVIAATTYSETPSKRKFQSGEPVHITGHSFILEIIHDRMLGVAEAFRFHADPSVPPELKQQHKDLVRQGRMREANEILEKYEGKRFPPSMYSEPMVKHKEEK